MRVVVAILLFAVTGFGADQARVRAAAARAITLLEASQKQWYTRQECFSCHHQLQPEIAFRAAREHGIDLDETIAHMDAVRAFATTSSGGASLGDLDRAVQYNHVIEPAAADAYRLVAAEAAGVRPNLVTAVYARLLMGRQNPGGDWDSFHQRPPASFSSFQQTAIAIRAIQLYAHPRQSLEKFKHIGRGLNWLMSHEARNTEDRTFLLFGLIWSGADKQAVDKAAADLRATQQSDGGWGSLDGRPSDAYSTGEALVALNDSGRLRASDPAYERGIQYLLDTQAADGSWHVQTRLHDAPVSPPYSESGYPYGHDQFISAQGSAWSIVALSRTLGPPKKSLITTLKEAEPPAAAPWVETVLFGSEADLKRLLDTGFDANSSTSGGTTALMMAAPDAVKMKLLLDHGASVNARTKLGYSALMVAAQYSESAAAMNLLLDRGAEVASPKGKDAPLFGANAFFLAAYAGNAAILPRLINAGASLDDRMGLIGGGPRTVMMGVVPLGKVDVIRALVDLGSPVDQTDGGGITPLGRAVLGNQVEVAKLLISRGADVNHRDNYGMTPLLWAANVDFGDSAMIELLKNSGARLDVKTKDGLTPLELARKHQHTHLIAALMAR